MFHFSFTVITCFSHIFFFFIFPFSLSLLFPLFLFFFSPFFAAPLRVPPGAILPLSPLGTPLGFTPPLLGPGGALLDPLWCHLDNKLGYSDFANELSQ